MHNNTTCTKLYQQCFCDHECSRLQNDIIENCQLNHEKICLHDYLDLENINCLKAEMRLRCYLPKEFENWGRVWAEFEKNKKFNLVM